MPRPDPCLFALVLTLACGDAGATLPADVAQGIEAAAARGESEARLLAAEMILRGELAGDADTARDTLADAAAAGQARAAYVLGALAARGGAASRASAFAWWRAAADAGDADAQFDLGLALVDSDPAAAEHLWEAAAARQHVLACYALGTRLARSAPDRARSWLECAARQDYAPAQFNLARLYERGIGGDTDVERARALYAAAAPRFPPAAQALAALPAAPAIAPAASLRIHDAAWLLAQPADSFTVQVATGTSERALRDALANAGVSGDAACVLERPASRQPWSAVLGIHAGRDAADRSLAGLPAAVQDHSPWIRRLGPLQQALREVAALQPETPP